MKHTVGFLAVCGVAVALWPFATHAAYTFHGRTFATFDEMVTYTREYLKNYPTTQASSGKDIPSTSTGSSDSLSKLNISRADVTSGPAYDVDLHEARLLGTIEFDDADYVKAWFIYGTNASVLDEETPYEIHDRTRSRLEYDAKLRDLDDDTRYYYRAVVSDENGKRDYGKLRSFRTPIDQNDAKALVRVYSGGANDVDDTRATLRGELYFKQVAPIYAWFEWGEDINDLEERSPRVTYRMTGKKTLEHTVYGLEPDTDYFYRYVGVYPDGTLAWGKATKFHTARERDEKEEPEIKANAPTDVTSNTAVVSVTADMNDYRNGEVFLLYGEDGDAIKEALEDFSSFGRVRERGDALQKVLLDDDLDRKETYTYTLRYLDQDMNIHYVFGIDWSGGLEATFKSFVRTKRAD